MSDLKQSEEHGSYPRVSAFITVYNEEEGIGKAIESLLNQTEGEIEILVWDDGSSDRTPEILAEFGEAVTVLNEGRLGRAEALARVTQVAHGKYLANLDADDLAYPERLKKQADYLDAHDDVGWIGCGEERQDSQRGESYVRLYPESDEEIRLQSAKCIPFCHSGVMIRKAVIDGGLNYDPKQKYLIDFELFLRVAKEWKAANLPEALVVRKARGESFFQSQYTYKEQNQRLIELSKVAIRNFRLPFSSRLHPLFRQFYPCLPSGIKRMIRSANGLKESPKS